MISKLRRQQEKWSVVGHALDGRYLLRPSFNDPEIYIADRAMLNAHLTRVLWGYASLAVLLLSIPIVTNEKLVLLFPMVLVVVFGLSVVNTLVNDRTLKKLEVINTEECQKFRKDNYWKIFAGLVFQIALLIFCVFMLMSLLWSNSGFIFDAKGDVFVVGIIFFSPLFVAPFVLAYGIWRKLT